VKEHIVTETAVPVVRPRVVTRPAVVDYAYGPTVTEAYALAPAPAPRVVTRPVVVDYGARATEAYALAPQPVVTVPAVRPYRYLNNRLLLVDPVTGAVVGETND
jgi:hypothetical protein